MGSSIWVKIRKDKRHYYYLCDHCKKVSKYLKTPYCPYCGFIMENSGEENRGR